jgi:hypothetical protein
MRRIIQTGILASGVLCLLSATASAIVLHAAGTAWHNGHDPSTTINDKDLNTGFGAYTGPPNWPWTPTVYWSTPQDVNSVFFIKFFGTANFAPQLQYSYDAWDGSGGTTMTWSNMTQTYTNGNYFSALTSSQGLTGVRAVRFTAPDPGGNVDQSRELWIQGGRSTYTGQFLWQAGTVTATTGTASAMFDNINDNAHNWGNYSSGNGDISASNYWHQTLWDIPVALDGAILFSNGGDYTVKGLRIQTLRWGGDPLNPLDWITRYSDSDNPNDRVALFSRTMKTRGVRVWLTQAGNYQSFVRDMILLDGGAVPEPGTLAVMAMAGLVLAGRRTRRG